MAATVLGTNSQIVFPVRHASLGPYITTAGGGTIYVPGVWASAVGQVTPSNALTSDPATWFQGTEKTMSSSSTTAIQAMATYRVGDIIHIATQIATGAVYYNYFDMATASWGLTTSETAVAAASFAPTAGRTMVSITVRSTGEPVIAYCAGLTAMSSGFHMVRYTRRTGTNTYSAPVNVDGGGSITYAGGIAVLGASDRVHFFYQDGTNFTSYQRTLTSANSLQAQANAILTTAGLMPHALGVAYADGASTRVRTPLFRSLSGVNHMALVGMDSADTPTQTAIASPVSDSAVGGLPQNQIRAALVNNGTTLYMLWVDSAGTDLISDTSTDNGTTWGTDTTEIAGTINFVSANVYTRSGNTVIGMVVDDAAVIKYAEITLAAAATTSFPFQIETPYRILSRR